MKRIKFDIEDYTSSVWLCPVCNQTTTIDNCVGINYELINHDNLPTKDLEIQICEHCGVLSKAIYGEGGN
jgi:hypothetical protein